MIHSREETEKLESAHLGPYACRSGNSRGRFHEEKRHPYRSEFQRDRDRVVFSRSFRRLEYKTQVFVNGTADHYRTRLTHTIEMAAIGRTMARALRVNEDLTEAIALAHDIGHSPFGHVGERALNELMADEGGFDHNIQSLRWVEKLEEHYPEFPGINLTWEVRAGLRKHLANKTGAELDGHPIGPFQSVEAQIADVADDIAYHSHDADDGLESGLITEDQLRELQVWQWAEERAKSKCASIDDSHRRAIILHALLDMQVENVLMTSGERISRHAPRSPDEIRTCRERVVCFSEDMQKALKPFRSFLSENVYHHPSVADANEEAVDMMRKLFMFYIEHPEEMGSKARGRIEEEGLRRTACDYVSGCTDRYALEEYMRFGLNK